MFVHAVLECFASVDEDDGNFVIELTSEFGVGIDVNLLPGEAAATGELGKTLLHDLTKMAALPRVNHNVVSGWHASRF